MTVNNKIIPQITGDRQHVNTVGLCGNESHITHAATELSEHHIYIYIIRVVSTVGVALHEQRKGFVCFVFYSTVFTTVGHRVFRRRKNIYMY